MKTKVLNEEPYADIICQHVNREFPHTAQFTQCEVVEAISNLIVGTKEVRYGSLPSPEHLVVLRSAIRQSVEKGHPIPILVPWGSIKSDFSPMLDISEVSAIQRLVQLDSDILNYYNPGTEIVIRVEDTSGYTLFTLEADQEMIKRNIDLYSKDMKNLVSILSPANSIRVELESEMFNAKDFNTFFEINSQQIEEYLLESWNAIQFYPEKVTELESYKLINSRGWKGIISYEQRMHYVEAYKRLYSTWDIATCIKRLSLYFGGAWTRFQLNMTGKQSYWDKFIQLAFIPPIKGLPEGYNFNYVYHRTLPLSQARTHIPPWRAKGYFKINGNTIQHKLTTFGDTETISQLTPVVLEISDDTKNLSVNIKADYLLES